jgi:gamma-glutamyltranspeptidase/glutathione hydrolase
LEKIYTKKIMIHLRKWLVISSAILTAIVAHAQIVGQGKSVDPYHYTIHKSGEFSHGSIACAHPLASEVGIAIMQKGGNAFDAAIAVQLTLAVVYSDAGNIGGGGFLTARQSGGKLLAIDYREEAPANASRDMYLDKEGNAQTTLSQNGHLASGVPGTVAGLFATLPYCKLPFKELIAPAIALAEKGFCITESEARSLNRTKSEFEKYCTEASAFVRNEKWKAGDTLVQKDLAETLKRIRDKGAAGFYEGKTAGLIVAEMERGNGLITLSDLKNYHAKQRTPLSFNHRGYEIISFPPPSSGGILLEQMLKMIAPFPMKDYGFGSIKSVQLMVEAERRAYADRAAYMGDPDFWKVPLKTLVSDAYLEKRMSDYDSAKATPSNGIDAGIIHESEETTHISIADAEGNIVSITTTLNGGYGSRVVVGGAGFLLNNEMDDFSVKPGVPNMFGAVGGAANAIAPGKRMLSSMTPTIVLKNGKPFLVVGTPGGTTIPTSVFQSLVDIIDFGMSVTDAVNKSKFHHQWLPDVVYLEKGFNPETKIQLESMGYKTSERSQIGRTEIIEYMHNGMQQAVADNRGNDSVAGY